jgi:hypothetical protein
MPIIRAPALAALLLLASTAVPAADGGSLGRAFRPQEAPPPPAVRASAPAEVGARGDGAPGLRVVVLGANRSLAAIDGRIVRLGDLVNGMRVAEIGPRGVLLVGEDGAKEHLRLSPAAVKRAHPAAAAQNSNAKESGP